MHKHTNRLATETSPYLLQHAHNPVNWFAWGEEAFELARQMDKPMLVSIGYSACHWCHVMERESFEQEDIAAFMNDNFVNIKIDREERPDIDHIYMDAVQAMTGSGGWPLNVFLLTNGKPFFGGTYFPPVRAFNRSSWLETLQAVALAYKERKNELESQANNLIEHIKSANTFGLITANDETPVFDREMLNTVCQNMLANADTVWGGFGRVPKFPQTFTITFLLRHYYFTKNENALQHALLSLDKMIYGGIYDQISGGFARYSTDEKWLAPHFEKMLYDNALLVSTLCEAYQLTKKPLYAKTIRQTLAFIKTELCSGACGFYSALDADSEGVEGKYYTWSRQEIDEILKEESGLFCSYYNVTDKGNWEHTNILWVSQPLSEFVEKLNGDLNMPQTIEWYENFFTACAQKLLQHRSKRIAPGLDDKMLLGWNALMNTAFSKAFAALGDEVYRQTAINNMLFIEAVFTEKATGDWLHTYKNNMAKYPAFLEDLSYVVQAYIHLQEITGNQQYLLKAKTITQLVIDNFKIEDEPFFYFTNQYQKDNIIRKKEVYDGATPSGNSVMAHNLLYLSVVFDKNEWRLQAERMLTSLKSALTKYPTSFGNWAMALQNVVEPATEVAVVGTKAVAHIPAMLQPYVPNKILQVSGNEEDNGFALLAGKDFEADALFYLCRNYACATPVKDVELLLKNMKA